MLDYAKLKGQERWRAVEALESAYRQMTGPLTPEQMQGVERYGAGEHMYINHLMRNRDDIGAYGGADEQVAQWANDALSVLRRGKLPQTTRLHRGMVWDDRNLTGFGGELEAGLEWNEHSLISTSLRLDHAETFTDGGGRDLHEDGHIHKAVLHMVAPKGFPSICIDASTGFSGEEEIVLAPSSWKAERVVERDGIKHVLARCTGLLPCPDLQVVRLPELRPGGYQRAPGLPVYYGGQPGKTPDHGGDLFERPDEGPTGMLAWIPEKVRAIQSPYGEFVVDGHELEWGTKGDYLVQDPATGECWCADGHEFESVYRSVEIERESVGETGHSL
jgi:hypothetical protein